MTVKIKIDSQSMIKAIGIVLLAVVALAMVWLMQQAIILVLSSFFLALALNPSVSYLSSKLPRDSRVLGTAVAYSTVVILIGAFIYIAIPPLISDTRELLDRVPANIEAVQNEDNFVGNLIRDYDLQEETDTIVASMTNRLGATDGPLLASIGRISTSIVSVLTVLVLTFLMLVEGPSWLRLFWKHYPSKNRDEHKLIAGKMYGVVTGYVNGQLLVALIAASVSLIFMFLFTDIDPTTVLPLAGIVGLSGLIPLIGTMIGSIIVIGMALFESVGTAILMLAYFIIYQQIENNLIQPYIQSKTIDMSPLLIIIAVVFGFSSGGVLGGFIAIPVAGIIRVIVVHHFHHRASANTKTKRKKTRAKS